MPRAPAPNQTTTLEHCLLLAALLHVWLVLVLGNAPAGTAQPGRGVWGAINITLRGPAEGPAAAVPPPPAPVLPGGPEGQAPSTRWGGAVREQRTPPPEVPGAARLGTWGEQPRSQADPLLLPAPSTAPAELPAMALPAVPPPPPGRVLQERAEATVPAAATEAAPPPPPPAERRLESTLSQPPAPRAAAAPIVGPAPLPAADLPAALPALAAPAAVRALPVPETPRIAQPAPPAAPQPAPVAEAAPVPAPVLKQLEAITPANAPARVAPLAPAARQEPLAVAAPPGLATPVAAVPGPRAPDAGVQLGHDVATAPSVPASAPRLNLELPRLRGGELSRYSTPGVLPVLPRPPELPDKLGRDIEKAARADCRKAYGNLGILGVVPLAADSVSKDGCKW